MKEIKDDTNRWKDIRCSWIEESTCENDSTTQSNLQIQCNLYQITNGIFYGTRTKNPIICMETKKTQHSQSSLVGNKTELEESNSLSSDCTTKLQ